VQLLANYIRTVKEEQPSPRIKHVSWGRLEVEGRAEPYKDAKLFPGGRRRNSTTCSQKQPRWVDFSTRHA